MAYQRLPAVPNIEEHKILRRHMLLEECKVSLPYLALSRTARLLP